MYWPHRVWLLREFQDFILAWYPPESGRVGTMREPKTWLAGTEGTLTHGIEGLAGLCLVDFGEGHVQVPGTLLTSDEAQVAAHLLAR